MSGVLLDTHALYWLVSAAPELSEEALVAISVAASTDELYVSPMSAWELAIASQKAPHRHPVQLGDKTAAKWFAEALSATGAKLVPIGKRIAFEAAAVASSTGHKDPGDCYLIATARVKSLPIITRDAVMHRLGNNGYLAVLPC